jgi:hypothetical protein
MTRQYMLIEYDCDLIAEIWCQFVFQVKINIPLKFSILNKRKAMTM